LIRDGIINNYTDEINIEMKPNGIIVNGKKLPDKLTQKYRELYKSYFGKYSQKNIKIIESECGFK
jgi:hypothetical protein